MDPNAQQTNLNQLPSEPVTQVPENPIPATPAIPQPQNKSKLKSLLLFAAVLIILILILLGILNYFNVLSLSTFYPNQLGFIPHITKTSQVALQTQPALNPKQTAINGKELPNEAKPDEILSYISQMTQRFPNPTPPITTDPTDIKVSGIFSGYSDNYFQIIGADKTATNFWYDSSTTFNSLNAAESSPSPNTLVVSQSTSNNFLKPANFGKYLQIDYTSTISGYLKAFLVSF